MSKIKLYFKVMNLYLRRKLVSNDDIAESYDKISSKYNELFMAEMHLYNDLLLSKIDSFLFEKKLDILDLAAGTGYNSLRLNEISCNNNYVLVDLSKGMLNQAKLNTSELNAEYHNMDMLDYLSNANDNTFDIIICNWALKYQDIDKTLRECNRVLRDNGMIICLINSKKTLPEIRGVYLKLLEKNIKKINKLMMVLPNPRNQKEFNRSFNKNGFNTLFCESYQKKFSFTCATKKVDFITNTGALAGFDVMLDLHDKSIVNQMVALIEKENNNDITHIFYGGIFKKGGKNK